MPHSPLSALALALPLAFALTATATAQKVIHTLSGSTADSWGQVCDLVGDFHQSDKKAEILVGAWRDDNENLIDAGSCFIYAGSNGARINIIFGTGAGDHVGYGSSGAGDANKDGFYDMCVAGDEDNVPGVGTNAGSARIISGFDGSVLHNVTGTAAQDLYGWSTAAVGDVNGDTYDDVAIGALLDEGGGSPNNAGSVTIISGFDGSVIHRVYGTVPNGQLGSNVGKAGDVNNDGKNDFIAMRQTRAYVFDGATGNVLWNLNIGASGKVSGGVDVNLDGYDDVIVGSAGGTGRVRVFSGLTGTVIHNIVGENEGLGASVVGAGDLDGDGYGDFCAGAPFADQGGNNAGAIRAFSGRTGQLIFSIPGLAANHRIGQACGGGHDVDGDGVNDVVATASASARGLVASFVPQGIDIVGTGTPGCRGSQGIGADSVPQVGNSSFTLHSSNASAGLPGLLLISDVVDPTGLSLFGVLLHASPVGSVFLAVTTPPADANGSIRMNLPIPGSPGIAGGQLGLQFAGVWAKPGCPITLSTSRGARMTIQP